MSIGDVFRKVRLEAAGLIRVVAASEQHIFGLVFSIIFVVNFLAAPSEGYSAELWAEMGTNYLRYGMSDGFWSNIVRTDAGYLVLYPRLIAFLLSLSDWGVWNFPLLAQIVAHLSIAFFSAAVIFSKINPMQATVSFRLLLALVIGLYPGYELRTYVNFTYLAFPLITFSLFWDLRFFGKVMRWPLLLLVIILIASKGLFIIFLPLFVLRLTWDIRQWRGAANILFSGLVVMVLLWQLQVMLGNNTKVNTLSQFSLLHFLSEWLPYYFHLFSALFVRKPPVFIAFLLSLIVVFWVGVRFWKIVRVTGLFSEQSLFLATLLFLGSGMLFINYVVSLKEEFILPISVKFWDVGAPQMNRQYVGINLTVIILLLVLVQFSRHWLRQIVPLLVLLLAVRCEYFAFGKADLYARPEDSFSDWVAFRNSLQQPLSFIPVNPYPWYLINGGKVDLLRFEPTSAANVIRVLGRPLHLVATYAEGCRDIALTDGEGEKLHYSEISMQKNGHPRKHRILTLKSANEKSGDIWISCKDSLAPRRLEVLLHYDPIKI